MDKHLNKIPDERLLKSIMDHQIRGRRDTGRPWNGWTEAGTGLWDRLCH